MEQKEIQALSKRIQALTELTARMSLAADMGYQYGGARDVYQALGYPSTEITFAEYLTRYSRQDMAKAIIDRPVKAAWAGDVMVSEAGDEKETQLEKAYKELYDQLKLRSVFSRLDRLTGIGRYGVLVLGTSDIKTKDDFSAPVRKGSKLKLLYVKPFSEDTAQIGSTVKDPNNPRYGKPENYSIQLSTEDILTVHYSRVIHTIDDMLEDEVYGIPRLKGVYNRLMDLEKLVGGSAEMFWRGARPGYQGKLDENYKITDTVLTDLKDQIDEFEHNLRRILVNEGIDLQALEQQVSDPTAHVDVQMQMISAVTGIPKRILTGSERGELASSQDKQEWLEYVQNRRDDFMEPRIVRPFVDACIEIGVLPKPSTGEYQIQWSDLFALSDKDKAEIGKARAAALKDYGANPVAESVIPPEGFLKYFLGLDEDDVEWIQQVQQAQLQQEQPLTPEEEAKLKQQEGE